MKQITLSIPEEKYSFFVELLNSIDFVSIDNLPSIPEEHKKLVADRKAMANEETMKSWDNIKGQFKINE